MNTRYAHDQLLVWALRLPGTTLNAVIPYIFYACIQDIDTMVVILPLINACICTLPYPPPVRLAVRRYIRSDAPPNPAQGYRAEAGAVGHKDGVQGPAQTNKYSEGSIDRECDARSVRWLKEGMTAGLE